MDENDCENGMHYGSESEGVGALLPERCYGWAPGVGPGFPEDPFELSVEKDSSDVQA
jgi:hypothetical protein